MKDISIIKKYMKVHLATRWTIRHGFMLLWFKDLVNVTEKLQFIDPTFQHYSLVPSSQFKLWWWWLTSWHLFTPCQKKGQLISERIKGPLVAAFRSPLMKALDRCWNIGSMNCNFSVTFIKSLNQSSIKPFLIINKLVDQI